MSREMHTSLQHSIFSVTFLSVIQTFWFLAWFIVFSVKNIWYNSKEKKTLKSIKFYKLLKKCPP